MPIHDWTRSRCGIVSRVSSELDHRLAQCPEYGRVAPRLLRPRRAVDSRPDPGRTGLCICRRRTRNRPAPTPGLAVAAVPPVPSLSAASRRKSTRARPTGSRFGTGCGDIVAVIEIVSPGNKASKHALHSFRREGRGIDRQGVHLLVIDLFPPSKRDPQGIHKAIWDEFTGRGLSRPAGKPLTAGGL